MQRNRIKASQIRNILIIALLIAGCGYFIYPSSRFVPPFGTVILFIGQDRDTIENYIQTVRLVPPGVMSYTSIQDLEGLEEPADRGAGVQHGDYFVKHYFFTILQIGLYMVNALDKINDGIYDENIRHLAEWVHDAKRPVYLRIGYEFDLPENGYDPEKYQKAFRHIVDIFRQLKVDNVAFVWHSYSGYVEGSRMRWYPGDEYVDWFAISFFDAYNDGNYNAFARLAHEHGKPLMIAEAAPRGMSTSDGKKVWDTWFQSFFKFIRRHDVRVACYINSNWDDLSMFRGQGWGDSRIQQSDFILNQWRKEVHKSRYLVSGLLMYSQVGYQYDK